MLDDKLHVKNPVHEELARVQKELDNMAESLQQTQIQIRKLIEFCKACPGQAGGPGVQTI